MSWMKFDEDERNVHFAQLIKLLHFDMTIITGMSHALMLILQELGYEELVRSHQNDDDNSSRISLSRPTPTIVGTNANKSKDRFTIEKFSHLQGDLYEIFDYPGYRKFHSSGW